jgi:hypothetical protein
MATLADVFRQLNQLKADAVISDYAIGGATAMLFYTEPTRTYDVDVFVLGSVASGALAPLTPIYEWARERGFSENLEHVLIHGVPVQFILAHNPLAEEAVATAHVIDYDGVSVRVIAPEHLAALALQAGGARRRERAWQLLESENVDRTKLKELLTKYAIEVERNELG